MIEDDPAEFPKVPARSTMPDWYPSLLASVTHEVSRGQRRAISGANREVVEAYWNIGNQLVAREKLAGWGAKVVTRLAADLREKYPTLRGFSPRNLRYMKRFAEVWPEMLQQPVATLPWGHNIILIEKLRSNDEQRN
ncbi:DUF1016 N-terminal domain-containing protein [Cryobacterium fucosi]|uniref:DUF1016 family protein n=1 Tax=Cryobacterium fucosi TaxID=1259157 RepID=A0A4R9BC58_9MICO|nr:DUF1016 N-terminal domain-containing protein [Cryobacterium fucosi]TFD79204.1 DUF1016 family protein [Cryobacterium fucosi]